MTLQELARRAKALPEPHRTDAIANVRDAWDDIVEHPLRRDEILADLQCAIEAHKAEAEREAASYDSRSPWRS